MKKKHVPFFFFLLFLLLRPFTCSSRILSSAICDASALLRVDISHAYRNSDRYLRNNEPLVGSLERSCRGYEATRLSGVPVDVIVLVHAVELELKAAEQVLDHDPQVVVEDPGTQAGQVLPLGLVLDQQAVKGCVNLLCLAMRGVGDTRDYCIAVVVLR